MHDLLEQRLKELLQILDRMDIKKSLILKKVLQQVMEDIRQIPSFHRTCCIITARAISATTTSTPVI